MKLVLAAVGQKLPQWISTGFTEYQKRLPPHLALSLCEIPAGKRGKNPDVPRLKQRECELLLKAAGSSMIIALDENGSGWSTVELARQLNQWQQGGRDVTFIIGGPDGLAETCLQRAEHCWSLGPLVLPHGLVRVIVAEQLYRAWSISAGHPYHRE